MIEQPILAARLVSLLRAALWQTEADPKLFGCQPVETGMSDSQPAAADTSGSRSVNADASGSKSADWNALYALAQQQTVAPLVYTAILTLPEALRPDGTWLRTAYPLVLRTRQAHRLLNGTLAEAVAARGAGSSLPPPQPHPRKSPCRRPSSMWCSSSSTSTTTSSTAEWACASYATG